MIYLRREQAPIAKEAWAAIDEQARRALGTYLAARKWVDFEGPLGWQQSAVGLGRTELVEPGVSPEVVTRLRCVQPFLELRAGFTLLREELDAVPRGAEDVDLEPVVKAARQLALAEDRAVFFGVPAASIRGIVEGAAHEPLALQDDFLAYPAIVANAMSVLRSAGVDGPYAIALSPRSYAGLLKTMGAGGYPVMHHIRKMLDGPVVWAPALEGAIVSSVRGDDFKLIVGQDVSIGYLDHDRKEVELYLVESMTFRLLAPEAAVPLVHPKAL